MGSNQQEDSPQSTDYSIDYFKNFLFDSLSAFTFTHLSPLFECAVSALALKGIFAAVAFGGLVLENSNGSLLVYASSLTSHEKRLKLVSAAAEKMARLLKLNFEVVTFGENFTPIYIYYKNGEEEPIPLYCDKGSGDSIQAIYAALRNMMFVLSFHPRHSALAQIRKGITQLS